jgi:predicted dehydrogenase
MKKLKVGVIGCGNISETYFENLTRDFNRSIDVVACADIVMERAKEACELYNIPKALTVDELISDNDVELVLNITIPAAHYDINMKALEAGKHVHVEKPLSLTREQGNAVLELAGKKGLRVGAAPDTFMGAGLQTCRKLIDEGWIGRPTAASAFMMSAGIGAWHPNPQFFYKAGGGPMFDMGPYYVTALVSLLGPVEFIAGMTNKAFDQRINRHESNYGQVFDVEVPTHVAGLMRFRDGGVVSSIITSFDCYGSKVPRIEIYGTEGSLLVPDPNTFKGPVFIKRKNYEDWAEIPLTHSYNKDSRGIGIVDIASAIENNREHRASGKMAYHVLDIMTSFYDASDQNTTVKVESSCERPAPLAMDLPIGEIN